MVIDADKVKLNVGVLNYDEINSHIIERWSYLEERSMEGTPYIINRLIIKWTYSNNYAIFSA